MKTITMGVVNFAITVVTVVIVLAICNNHSRSINLQDNLQEAVESSVEAVMLHNDDFNISDTDALVNDLIDHIALYLADDCSLDVKVKAVDMDNGLLSVEVIEHYKNMNGEITDVHCEKTVILDEYDSVTVGKYKVQYIISTGGTDFVYKQYELSSGANLLVPKNPSVDGFLGWRQTGTDVLSADTIRSMTVDRDYVFYAVCE